MVTIYFCLKMQRLNPKYRILKDTDKDLVNTWLKGWGLNELEREMYPDTGLVLYNEEDNTPIYIGFIWIPETSNMAMIGFITRNPFYKAKLPKGLRKQFVSELRWECKRLGKSVVISWTDNPFLVQDFKELNFAESSDRCRELIQKIL